MPPRAIRPSLRAPAGIALALHVAVALAVLSLPRQRLMPAPDPPAIDLLALPAPETPPEALLVGGVDLLEAEVAPVIWPEAAASPVPQPVARPPVPRRTVPAPQPGVAAAPGAAQAASANPSPAEIAAWQAALSAWVEAHRRYPPAARFRQEEGVVQVHFELDPGGRVRRVVLAASSGSAALDQAALSLLADAALPAPPPAMDAALRSVSLAIRYRLD